MAKPELNPIRLVGAPYHLLRDFEDTGYLELGFVLAAVGYGLGYLVHFWRGPFYYNMWMARPFYLITFTLHIFITVMGTWFSAYSAPAVLPMTFRRASFRVFMNWFMFSHVTGTIALLWASHVSVLYYLMAIMWTLIPQLLLTTAILTLQTAERESAWGALLFITAWNASTGLCIYLTIHGLGGMVQDYYEQKVNFLVRSELAPRLFSAYENFNHYYYVRTFHGRRRGWFNDWHTSALLQPSEGEASDTSATEEPALFQRHWQLASPTDSEMDRPPGAGAPPPADSG